jgi:hypothetical protein
MTYAVGKGELDVLLEIFSKVLYITEVEDYVEWSCMEMETIFARWRR